MTQTPHPPADALSIAVIGTGNIAEALAGPWAAHGHRIIIGGRSRTKASALASRIGRGAQSAPLPDAARGADVVLFAVPWDAVDEALARIGARSGLLDGVTLIDPTNPVVHGVGQHLLRSGSAAEHIAAHAPGAHVVKAFNVHPASHWATAQEGDVVAIAGDDTHALEQVRQLVRELGATPHSLGGLDRARQVEELAGTVIALAFGGVDPRSAIPGPG